MLSSERGHRASIKSSQDIKEVVVSGPSVVAVVAGPSVVVVVVVGPPVVV